MVSEPWQSAEQVRVEEGRRASLRTLTACIKRFGWPFAFEPIEPQRRPCSYNPETGECEGSCRYCEGYKKPPPPPPPDPDAPIQRAPRNERWS